MFFLNTSKFCEFSLTPLFFVQKNAPAYHLICGSVFRKFVPEKVDYPRKDNSNYPYSFFSNLLPLLIPAIGKLNKINILFENRRVFGVFTMWENKKALGYGRSPHISRLNFFLLDANQFYLFQDNNVCPLHSINLALILYLICIQISMVYRFAFNHTAKIPHN